MENRTTLSMLLLQKMGARKSNAPLNKTDFVPTFI